MDYWGVVKGAWSITRRTRLLWWLGLISASQLVVYTGIVLALAAPISILPQLISPSQLPDSALRTQVDSTRERLLDVVAHWVTVNKTALILGVIAVFVVWLVLGVFDVAAQTGIITQANAVAEKRAASLRTGFADGFRLWWRAVGLLALAALPSLVYLLIMSIAMYATVSWPLSQGRLPQAGAAMMANIVLSPLGGLASLVSIPLAVLVQLGMRYAVIDDLEWRDAFSAGWKLAGSNLAEVAIMYVALAAVGLVATVVFVLAIAAAAVVASVLVLGVAVGGTGGDLGASGRIAVIGAAGLGAMLLLAFQAMMFVWMSSAWTLFWRAVTARVEGNPQ